MSLKVYESNRVKINQLHERKEDSPKEEKYFEF